MYKQVCLKYWIFAITICGSICTGCLLQLLVQNFFFPINITENMSIISSIVAVLSLVFSIMAFTFKMNSFKQERFEITFFNLLDQKRKTEDSIFVKCEDLDGSSFILNTYKGEEAWKRIWKELTYIKIALSNPNYLKPIEGSSSYNEISASMRAPIETLDAEIKNCYIRRVNYTYQITRDLFEEAKKDRTNDDKLKRCFNLWVDHNLFFYEHYFHLLQVILTLLKDTTDKKYPKLLLAQMSKYQLKVLYCLQLLDDDFRYLLKEAKVEKLLQQEIKSLSNNILELKSKKNNN